MDLIYLWVGKVVVLGIGGLFVLGFICCGSYLLWQKVLQYFFFKIKHLFPRWQWSQDFVDEWIQVAKNAEPSNWRSQVTIEQKGRFVKWHCPTSHFGSRTEYVLVKR